MANLNLHERIETYVDMGGVLPTLPAAVTDNLNPAFPLRPYQEEALRYLLHYLHNYPDRKRPCQLLFHMATGSGKTLIMAASILHLYEHGYRNFVFFVHLDNIIQKTRDNFLNPQSSKYLFAPSITLNGQPVALRPVGNFQAVGTDDINIVFTTIQGLHTTLNNPRENSLTYEDFERQPLVLISDEAHHINALTKTKSQRLAPEIENINTWEATVDRIFASHSCNILLEFTATVELSHPAVAEKYSDKILYEYPLKQFREDGYSKEVRTLQADLPQMDRALQAVVISQYRKKVAQRHNLQLKPVVLMKANYVNPPTQPDPNKVVSSEFRQRFHDRMRTLSAEDLDVIRVSAKSPLVQKAFKYFDANDIQLANLVQELKSDFSKERALSVDSLNESREHQLLVNSLEDADNEIRTVFAVEKLNEGWDVLNLFDIVRLYDTRDAKDGRPGKTTIAEAQLIGRGARYYPFRLNSTDPLYTRKFDDDLDNELRVLEELYYHSAHNSRYIAELHTALVQTGMKPETPTRQLRLNLKDNFKDSQFWKHGALFTNQRLKNDNADVFGLQPLLTAKRHTYRLRTGHTEDLALLEEPGLPTAAETITKTLSLSEFGTHLLRVALAKIKFYRFGHLKQFFPHLDSITEFVTAEDYLAQVKVDVTATQSQLENLSRQQQLDIAVSVLGDLADDIRRGTPTYIGSKVFTPRAIKDCVEDRKLERRHDPHNDVGTGMSETTNIELHADLKQADWYVYDENYGTNEEKALVKFIESQIPALRERFSDIYLLRNEKLFQLYTFDEGRPLEPDFVLFGTENESGKAVSYQIFIEPKGPHLVKHDDWKERFLECVADEHKITVEFPNRDFRLVGLPFFNMEDRRALFEERFLNLLMQPHQDLPDES